MRRRVYDREPTGTSRATEGIDGRRLGKERTWLLRQGGCHWRWDYWSPSLSVCSRWGS